MFLASVFLGLVPMAIYAAVVCWLDRWEKEPIPLLIAAFGWGCVPSIVFAVVAQIALGMPLDAEELSLGSVLYQASIVAPVTEEFIKAMGLLLIFLLFKDEVDSVLDGLIYGSMIGFGFAAVENVLYFSGQTDPAGLLWLVLLRAIIFGMLHALFTGLTGVGFALGKFASLPMKLIWPIVGLSLAIATHSLHNYFATMGGAHLFIATIGVSLGTLWFFGTVAYCLVRESQWIRLHLAEEVSEGVLLADQADDTSHFWKRSGLDLFSMPLSVSLKRREMLHLATKLAFLKQRQLLSGFDEQRSRKIDSLRRDLRRLSQSDPLVLSGDIPRNRKLPPPLPESHS